VARKIVRGAWPGDPPGFRSWAAAAPLGSRSLATVRAFVAKMPGNARRGRRTFSNGPLTGRTAETAKFGRGIGTGFRASRAGARRGPAAIFVWYFSRPNKGHAFGTRTWLPWAREFREGGRPGATTRILCLPGTRSCCCHDTAERNPLGSKNVGTWELEARLGPGGGLGWGSVFQAETRVQFRAGCSGGGAGSRAAANRCWIAYYRATGLTSCGRFVPADRPAGSTVPESFFFEDRRK